MVNRKIIMTMVGLAFTIVCTLKGFSQTNIEYSTLTKYRKWGIVAGALVYNKATIEPQYGYCTMTSKNMWGYNLGIEYDFNPDEKWSVITGFIVALEPIYNIEYTIKKKDLFPQFTEDVTNFAKAYAMTSFSAPLILRLNIPVGNKTFLNFRTGLKAMYFPNGEALMSNTFRNADQTESREVFGLKAESPLNSFQSSVIIDLGASYATKYILYKANAIYVVNFQNAMEGEYLFDNMFVSERSRGYYTLSGNYLGLLFTANLIKSKKKRQIATI